MKKYGYGYSDKPISAWGYVGYNILWAIPVLGWLIWLCTALFSGNQNKKSYARSYFCAFLLGLLVVIVAVVAVAACYAMGLITPEAIEGLLGGTTTA